MVQQSRQDSRAAPADAGVAAAVGDGLAAALGDGVALADGSGDAREGATGGAVTLGAGVGVGVGVATGSTAVSLAGVIAGVATDGDGVAAEVATGEGDSEPAATELKIGMKQLLCSCFHGTF